MYVKKCTKGRSNVYLILVLICATILIILHYFQRQLKYDFLENIDNNPALTSKSPTRSLRSKALFGTNLTYVLNSNCCNAHTLIIIIITSYFGNVETRSAMRRAFPRQKLGEFKVKRVFLLGLAPQDKFTTQNSVADENDRFGDIVQGNFQESYKNLTYKHVMGHKWVAERCRNVKYVIKMDDDIVMDLYKVQDMVLKFNTSDTNFMAGYVLKDMQPIREPANKWFVKSEEYNDSVYPPFVSGWFYITTPDISEQTVVYAQTTPYFWIDDVYVTGVIAKKLNIRHVNLKDLFTVHPEYLRCCVADVLRSGFDCEILVGPNGGDNNLYYEFNNAMGRCFYRNCVKRPKPLNETCVAERKFNLDRGYAVVNSFRLS